MTTGFYLLDNPHPAYRQYGNPRRNGAKVSGVFVIHSTESVPDYLTMPDTGAEQCARWIATRRGLDGSAKYGSYHSISDYDSIVPMAPWLYETWHETTLNNHSIGFSMNTRASMWTTISGDYRNGMIRNMGLSMRKASEWVETNRGIRVPARFITRSEAINKIPGIIAHGDVDIERRSDPWKHSSLRSEMERYLLEIFSDGSGNPVTFPESVPVIRAHNSAAKRFYAVGEVAKIQRYLATIGIYRGLIDDDYGPMTANAVKTYQANQLFGNLIVDGDWGPSTQSHYDWTKELQSALGIVIDGDYGPLTRMALLIFQDNAGLVKDAIPGPITCRSLGIRTHP